jgi:hypothetical protein
MKRRIGIMLPAHANHALLWAGLVETTSPPNAVAGRRSRRVRHMGIKTSPRSLLAVGRLAGCTAPIALAHLAEELGNGAARRCTIAPIPNANEDTAQR